MGLYHYAARGVDKKLLAAVYYQRQSVMKIIRTVELQRNNDSSGAIDIAALAFLFNHEESIRVLSLDSEAGRIWQQDECDQR